MGIMPSHFLIYLYAYWPDLTRRLEILPINQIIKKLDIICKISKSELFTVPSACARWQGILESMYAVNGNLEF